MPRVAYEDWKPKPETARDLRLAAGILSDYQARGLTMTLRQLHYQFVARGHGPNTFRAYKRLGEIVDRGRMAGLLDWNSVEDRTRNLEDLAHWTSPADIVDAVARQFRVDHWTKAPTRVEVWVEKEALAGIVEQAANRWDVGWLACRGYMSQSEMWAAAQRFYRYMQAGQNVLVVHLGDHDPSGLDMTRDIGDRLQKFVTSDWFQRGSVGEVEEGSRTATHGAIWADIASHLGDVGHPDWAEVEDPRPHFANLLEVRRVALNMDQVEEYDPPPNFAKLTDSRADDYVAQYGDESWELDALDPQVLVDLIDEAVESVTDWDTYNAATEEVTGGRRLLQTASDQWDDVVAFLDDEDGPGDPSDA